jgi:hypothetical protein
MTLHFLRRFEPMHGGRILKYYGECRELNSQTDGYYYYDPEKEEIAFLWLTSNGNVTIGNVKEEEGRILMYGHVIFPDRTLEFRNTNQIMPDGKVVDKYFRFENGEWLAGHSRIYAAELAQ